MTGYATVSSNTVPNNEKTTNKAVAIHIEIRSVNSRFLDLHFRLPDELRACEPALRSLITEKVKRGKVELRISAGHSSEEIVTQIPVQALQNLSQISDIVRNWLPDVSPLSVSDVIRLSQTSVFANDLQKEILILAGKALDSFLKARAREGAKLGASITERIAILRELAAQAEPLVPKVVEQQRQRFLERWEQIMQQMEPQLNNIPAQNIQERALSEATSFALRIDVSEELTRLKSHLEEIERLLSKGGDIGKKLDFLIQELHREANTMGSKSAVLEMTRIAVEMKVLIEQMREQVQNIE